MPADVTESATDVTAAPEYQYHVFISYSHADKDWVMQRLLKWLKANGFTVRIDTDFAAGSTSLENMENAVRQSRHTIAVLTPQWCASEWSGYEAQLVKMHDPMGRRRRLIPVLREKCKPNDTISLLTYRDFTTDPLAGDVWGDEWTRLLRDLRLSETTALPAGEASQEKAATASFEHSVNVLLTAIQDPHVRDRVVEFRTQFQDTSQELQQLKYAKDLHDLLHELDLHCFRLLQGVVEDFPSRHAIRECNKYRAMISGKITAIRELPPPPSLNQAGPPDWITELEDALKGLDQALKAAERDPLDETVELLQSFFASKPSNIDAELKTIARNLPLAQLATALGKMREDLQRLGTPAEEIVRFQHGAENLFNLKQKLDGMVREHNLWQEVENQLRLLDDMIEEETLDIAAIIRQWQRLEKKLDPLCRRAKAVREEREKLQEAVVAKDDAGIENGYVAFRSHANDRFLAVDKELKAFCGEIALVGAPVDALLEHLSRT